MPNQNPNKKQNNQSESIQKQFEISNKINFENTTYLYGMTFEQYKEGLEIHLKCFNQMENAKRIVN